MIQRTLSVILFALLSSFVAAQSPTPPSPTQGPPLMDSHKWEIRNENDDPIGYHAEFEIIGFDVWTGAIEYRFGVFNTRTGEDTGIYGYAYDPGFLGYVLDVWSSDSGLNYEMHWDGDHYDKVGGTAAVRSYHPM